MVFRHGILIGALLVLASFLAACGGGGATSSSAADTEKSGLSKAAYITRGGAICDKANTAVSSVKAPSLLVEAEAVTTVYVDMVNRLEALGAPEEEAGYAKFIAAAEALGGKEAEAKRAAEKKDEKKLGELGGEIGPLLENFEAAAKAYGMRKCAQGQAEPSEAEEGGGAPEGLEAEIETPLSDKSG